MLAICDKTNKKESEGDLSGSDDDGSNDDDGLPIEPVDKEKQATNNVNS